MESICIFEEAWIGRCKEPATAGDFCAKHAGRKCTSCGAVATHNCDETMGPLVCGADLCPLCEHALAPDGTNRYMEHIKKGTQKFKGWWEQTDEEKHKGKYLCLQRELQSLDKLLSILGENERIMSSRRECEAHIREMEQKDPSLRALE